MAQDKHASDSMAEAMELARLSRITRTAVRLIKGIQIVQSPESFDMTVYSVIGWFKVPSFLPPFLPPRPSPVGVDAEVCG